MTTSEDIFKSLDEFIAQASDEDSRPAVIEKPPVQARSLLAENGWDAKWRDGVTLSGEPWLEAYKTAQRVVEKGGIVVFHGTRGGGKTRMASELAKKADIPKDKTARFDSGFGMKCGYSPTYVTAMGFFLEVRATYAKSSTKTEAEVVKRLTTPSFLCIDEIQERSDSVWENRLLTHVIDARYGADLPTVLIANLKEDELKASLGPSIMSRIQETGGSIEFNWGSYRSA